MRSRPLIVLSVAAVLVAGATATAFANLSTVTTRAVAASTAPYANTFERPAAGGGYTRAQWSQDGFTSEWDLGMADRSWIDDTVAHSGGKSLKVSYPAGQVGPEGSGLSAKFDVTPQREYYISQWFRLSPDFSWGTTEYSGKIGIGLAGGASCSGGEECTGFNGYESRFIWNTDGRAALYYYHMNKAGTFGDEVDFVVDGKKVFYPRGQWVNVVQRLKVNTVTNGQADPNGEIEIWYNGKQAVLQQGIQFVRNADQVDAAYFDSFFGGDRQSFAPKSNSFIWYDDVKLSTNRADICELNAGGCTNGEPQPAGNQIISNGNSKCIDVPSWNFVDGQRLIVWDCTGGTNQKWDFVNDTLRTQNNKCMDVAGGSRDNGAAVQIYTCNGTAAQQFVLSGAGDLVNPQANKCVEVADENPDNDAILQLGECGGGAYQKWRRG